MARQGKNVDINDPLYLLDKNRGEVRIPSLGGEWIQLCNLKFKNRTAYDANYFEMKFEGKVLRVQKDELMEALAYV